MLKGSSTIRYIDYGNIASVPSNSLCVIQSQFINVPPYSLQCRFHNSKIIYPEINRKSVFEDIKAVTGRVSTHPSEEFRVFTEPKKIFNFVYVYGIH